MDPCHTEETGPEIPGLGERAPLSGGREGGICGLATVEAVAAGFRALAQIGEGEGPRFTRFGPTSHFP